MILAAFVSFVSFWLLIRNLPPALMRRLVGYNVWFDVVLHVSILWLFLGTSTMGLLQAEAAGICFSLYLRWYRWAWGYERYERRRWMRYFGHLTRRVAT